MTFYSERYLINNSNSHDTVNLILIFIAFIVFAAGLILYLRNRLDTRYRELAIIGSLFLLFFVGARYTDYEQIRSINNQQTQMTAFVKNFSKSHPDEKNVYFNSTTISNGMIVRLGQKYYTVLLSNDQKSYQINRTYLINSDDVRTIK
ncbi:DUF3290 domain-containing protein [Leuconostoc miyukkimchii]|uniref:DUF3290 domain-containing protein n=1 Tax=Leuconostoc miyukkimchii TaxID=910540 RepID=UPI001C7E0CE1|nr:DUF3290 domain-containing protein [Leuconostoc miyukkimchii]